MGDMLTLLSRFRAWFAAAAVCVTPLVATPGCAASTENVEASDSDLTAHQCSVLVVMSNADTLHAVGATLLNRGTTKDYRFGYLLDEMAVPVRALLDSGCRVTFANPSGTEPPRDKTGDAALYFTDGFPEAGPDAGLLEAATAKLRLDALVPSPQAKSELAAALRLVGGADSPIRGHGPGSFDTPVRFADLLRADGAADDAKLASYDAVFVPGGYAPMLNLWNDATLGTLLHWFHDQHKLTVTLCRGGVALRSMTTNGRRFPYAGYRMTTYSTLEDNVASLASGVLPLYDLPFHPNDKVREVGARVEFHHFHAWVVEDRELLTGENQWSAHLLASRFVSALRTRGALAPR